MSNDIREKAEAVITEYINDVGRYGYGVELEDAIQKLKAALRPSREEITANLESYLSMGPKISKAFESNVNYAIEELRSKE